MALKLFVDVGSTVLKFAVLDDTDVLINQVFVDRDYDTEVATQVLGLISDIKTRFSVTNVRICSSANGGLRVGVIAMTKTFSGEVVERLSLAAGANVLFNLVVSDVNDAPDVDVLVVTGGIDCVTAPRLRAKFHALNFTNIRFRSLFYAGNNYLADDFRRAYPNMIQVANPLGKDLSLANLDLLHELRLAYLKDLVDAKGIQPLNAVSEIPIWPTPGVVNLYFATASLGTSGANYPSPLMIIDIGGATTDLHFGTELLGKPSASTAGFLLSDNRYVFGDLGVSASKTSTQSRLRRHRRFFSLLEALYGDEASRKYADYSENEMEKNFLFAACLFLALDAVYFPDPEGRIPQLELKKLNAVLITGGASQSANLSWLQTVVDLCVGRGTKNSVKVFLDTDYQFWIHGLKLLSH